MQIHQHQIITHRDRQRVLPTISNEQRHYTALVVLLASDRLKFSWFN